MITVDPTLLGLIVAFIIISVGVYSYCAGMSGTIPVKDVADLRADYDARLTELTAMLEARDNDLVKLQRANDYLRSMNDGMHRKKAMRSVDN